MSLKKVLACHLFVVIFAAAVLIFRSSMWPDATVAPQPHSTKSPGHQKERLMSPPYQYAPLTSQRSIRVFALFPAQNRDAPIQGQLHEVDLDSRPSYEALSYLCGDKEPGHEVIIAVNRSGHSNQAEVVPVTPNCIAALRAVRYPIQPRTLWVDAICIDQAPSPEKSQQVALMTDIFETAETVLMWLNPGNETSTQVSRVARLFRLVGWLYRLRLLRLYERDEQADSRMPAESKAVAFWDKVVASGSAWLGGELMPLKLSFFYNCKRALSCLLTLDSFNAPFLNRYFHRVWTVQEIAMAHKILIHYGMEQIQWCDFVASGLFAVKRDGFARNQESNVEIFGDVEVHWNLINSLESHFVLPDIYGVEALYDAADERNTLSRYTGGTAELALFKSKGLEAIEPKDKAYAMLWAFPDSSAASEQLRRVDYEKPLEMIYTEFTTASFVRTNGSTIQFYLVNSLPRLSSLPSWVPDWNQTNSMPYFVWISRLRDFRAAKEDSLRYRIGIEGPLLRISGVEYCGIRALIRFSVESRQRNLLAAKAEDLVEALIDTAFLVKGLIDTAKQLAGPGHEEGILEAIHRVVHSQKTMYQTGAEDQLDFFARPKEKELSQRFEVGVGLLRIQVFDKLSFLVEEDTIPTALVEAALSAFLLPEEIQSVLSGASEHPHLIPFLAVVVALSPNLDLYHFIHIILLDHRDKDLFITTKGNIGIAFQGLQREDLIVLWQGCPSPMIVRKLPNPEEDQYQLHVPAYVDGIMTGEAWISEEEQLKQFAVV